jgi:hypothetical protein
MWKWHRSACGAHRGRRLRLPALRGTQQSLDAFGYFANRYGIDVVGAIIPSQTTQAQPSAQDLANLIHLIEREKVKAVFPESSLSPKVADAIASQTGASADYTLYGDTLGPAGSSGRRMCRWRKLTPTRWCAASPGKDGCGPS